MFHKSFSSSAVLFVALILLGSTVIAQDSASSEDGFKPIFDSQSLAGWQGDENFWRVEDGAIVGETTPDKKLSSNIFLTWSNGEVDDFQLRLKYRISGSPRANSGVQFRSAKNPEGNLMGYQADIDHSGTYSGILYDERGRGILAQRGHKVAIAADGQKSDETVNDAGELLKTIDLDQWNDYHIQALGDRFTLSINGKVMCELTDRQTDGFDRSGLLGLQLHAGPPMKIEFKDIQLKRLPLAMNQKKVVFIAGKPSHGWGAHEHNAGCLMMADCLNHAASETELPVVTAVYKNGWPADPTAVDNADTVVVYCDGGQGHFLHHHGQAFEDIMKNGTGLVCIHYGVEVPKGSTGQRFLQWIGGYFETDWSVNPHWNASFSDLPDHPITHGVNPFEMQDEWYYHMRFVPEMSRVTPILTALPPESTLVRKDGPHSGNPYVREAVKAKKPQHLAWAFVRGDGKGRGFGFTGGHFHRNWRNDDFRKIVLNAITWTAHVEVPDAGIQSATPSDDQMDANQDYPKPNQKK